MSVIKAHGCRCVAAVAHIGFVLLYRVLLVCFYITECSRSEFLPGSTFLFGVCISGVAIVRPVLRKGTKECYVLVTG